MSNRNKGRVRINLKDDEGRRAVHGLAAAEGIVVENFRPGTAARLGLGVETLRTKRPEPSCCSIKGSGPSWIGAHRP
jgi:crotonobetainyl-CoA:carnitine CoA-transferase CaiB-like acyl-CoA transferase